MQSSTGDHKVRVITFCGESEEVCIVSRFTRNSSLRKLFDSKSRRVTMKTAFLPSGEIFTSPRLTGIRRSVGERNASPFVKQLQKKTRQFVRVKIDFMRF